MADGHIDGCHGSGCEAKCLCGCHAFGDAGPNGHAFGMLSPPTERPPEVTALRVADMLGAADVSAALAAAQTLQDAARLRLAAYGDQPAPNVIVNDDRLALLLHQAATARAAVSQAYALEALARYIDAAG